MTEREISIVDAWVEKGIEFYVKYRPVFDILPLNLFDEEDLYGVYVQPHGRCGTVDHWYPRCPDGNRFKRRHT